jgi:hypothetical protein
MKPRYKSILLLGFLAVTVLEVFGQGPMLKRTTYKTDQFDFGAGGTLAIVGAPQGSIRVEGSNRNQIEISAEITVEAATEADLETMSKVTGFVLDESLGRTGIVSVGTHDKKYLKRALKKVPKALAGLPYRIDYVLKVPRYCDLQIDGGRGDLTISGVEGTMRLNFLETKATIDLVGGSVTGVFGGGDVDVSIASRSWRGRFVDIQVANGTMNLWLPTGLNADFDASILRTGKIENQFDEIRPRARHAEFTQRLIQGKAGTGGVPLKFTVGDGTLRIAAVPKP